MFAKNLGLVVCYFAVTNIRTNVDELAVTLDLAATRGSYVAPELPPEPASTTEQIAGTFALRASRIKQPQDTRPWQERMACLGIEPGLFYPEDDADPAEEAKAICAQCPVENECLENALATREKFGVAGGLTPRERRRIVRQRQKRARST